MEKLQDNKVFYVKAPFSLIYKPQFEEFENELKKLGFTKVDIFGSQSSLTEMLKLKCKFWCISVKQKTFVQTKEDYSQPVLEPNEFLKLHSYLHGEKYNII